MLAERLSAVAGWRTWADRIARHVVSLGIAPNDRARGLAEDAPWNWLRRGWLEGGEARRLVRDRLAKATSGSVALRFGIFDAGMESAGGPDHTVVAQCRRTSDGTRTLAP